LKGTFYKCNKCPNFFFCEKCEQEKIHAHHFLKIKAGKFEESV